MEQTNTEEALGIKHWLFQIIPPLSILSFLFLVEKGAAMIYLVGLLIFPVIISVISIIAKLIRFKRRKYYLIRPLLTIIFFLLMISITNWTYKIALEETISAAKIIQEKCNNSSTCPENPPDWIVDGSRIFRNDLGFWFKYTAIYSYKPQSFDIHLSRGRDMGDDISGGVNLPLKVTHYIEDQY